LKLLNKRLKWFKIVFSKKKKKIISKTPLYEYLFKIANKKQFLTHLFYLAKKLDLQIICF